VGVSVHWSDRDLTVLILAVVLDAVVGGVDALLDITPAGRDGLLNSALVFAALIFFYRLGAKRPPSGD